MLDLGEDQMTTALAMTVSMASGLKSNFGTSVKPLHEGQAAHNGSMAALTTRHGMTAKAVTTGRIRLSDFDDASLMTAGIAGLLPSPHAVIPLRKNAKRWKTDAGAAARNEALRAAK
ncbi:hypothetical protein P279_18760 [Rhodobacteraceae bacterium PD-2]|nr:hypothetical protein P279_18760 [Rhodobacteraceae bacterium PD-2]